MSELDIAKIYKDFCWSIEALQAGVEFEELSKLNDPAFLREADRGVVGDHLSTFRRAP
jgi:hypothetical protein